jgi:adenosylcobinamide-GDP ribazoletransferase
MGNIFRRFLTALSFLTILPFPIPSFREEEEVKEDLKKDFSQSSIFFPIVGLIMGVILFALDQLLQFINLPSFLHTGIILTIWVFLSGGLHLEGFADMVDGFSGGKNKADIIRIMKDGSVGAKGALALILLILLKYLLLFSLPATAKRDALLLAPMMGRWSMVLAGYQGKPASADNTLAQMFTLYLGRKELFSAALFTAVVSYFILSYRCIYLFLLTCLVTACLVAYSMRKIEGICGDLLGAINEINELIVIGTVLLTTFSKTVL